MRGARPRHRPGADLGARLGLAVAGQRGERAGRRRPAGPGRARAAPAPRRTASRVPPARHRPPRRVLPASRSSSPTSCSPGRCCAGVRSIRTGVIAVPLPGCSDGLLTLVTNIIALTPGTMPLQVTQDPTVLYVHVLHLGDVERCAATSCTWPTSPSGPSDRPMPWPRRTSSTRDRTAPRATRDRRHLRRARRWPSPCFAFRLLRGPTLADRVIAIDGLIVAGISPSRQGHGHRLGRVPAGRRGAHPGRSSAPSVIARFIEGRGE